MRQRQGKSYNKHMSLSHFFRNKTGPLYLAFALLALTTCASSRETQTPAFNKTAREITTPTKTIGKYIETTPGAFAKSGMKYIYFNNAWTNYLKRNNNLDLLLQDCANNPERYSPQFQIWATSIQSFNNVPDVSPYVKAMLGNMINNELIEYDRNKATLLNIIANARGTEWLQTIYTTFEERESKGTCGDYVIAKYDFLKRIGFKTSDMRILSGQQPNGKYHMVLVLTLANNDYVLDGPLYIGSKDSPPIKLANADLIPAEAYFAGYTKTFGNGLKHENPSFTPVMSISDDGIKLYAPSSNSETTETVQKQPISLDTQFAQLKPEEREVITQMQNSFIGLIINNNRSQPNSPDNNPNGFTFNELKH